MKVKNMTENRTISFFMIPIFKYKVPETIISKFIYLLLFWKYYAKSPFAGDMFERMSKAYQSNSMAFVKHYLLNPRHRQHATDLLKYGVIGGVVHTIKRKLFKK